MKVPPTIVRRVVIAPLVLVLDLALAVLSPLFALLAAVVSPFTGGTRPLRLVALAVGYATRHAAATLACLGLWLRSGFGRRAKDEQTQRRYYRVMSWFVDGVFGSVVRHGRVEVTTIASADAEAALEAAERPTIVLSRHAGEGDSLLVLQQLLCRYRRRPRVVLHEALRMDPLIDALGRHLPNRFVDPRGGDTEVEIAAMTRGIDAAGAVLIFPEGGNFSSERRERSIRRLLERGHHEQARQAEDMEHVAPPRPGGALAAIEAAPHADVVFVGHVGVPHGMRETWRAMAEPSAIELRLWLVPASDVPVDRGEQIDWLFDWWRTLDTWVAERVSATL